MSSTSTLFTPKQLVNRHGWLTERNIRYFLAERQWNGLARTGAVLILGKRRLLIDEPKFLEWALRREAQ